MKNAIKLFSMAVILGGVVATISSCNKDTECNDVNCLNGGVCQEGTCYCPDGFGGADCSVVVSAGDTTPTHDGNTLGWNTDEDHSNVPMHVVHSAISGTSTLPSSIDLEQYFPPIQNQGAPGTCVDWSVAYYGFTAMEAIDFGLDPDIATNQGSPKALWCATPRAKKGLISQGLEVMLHQGVADMSLVPYDVSTWDADAEDFTDCNNQGTIPVAWSADAAQHAITHYRKLSPSVEEIKTQLAQKHPVMFTAFVYTNFGTPTPDNVYTALDGTRRGGHAMIIQGYDDSKNAFKVRNSWGDTWNGNGTIWIDYNLMVSSGFTNEGFFVMSNDGHQVNLGTTTTGGADLVPWLFYDHAVDFGSNTRNYKYNMYNIGDATVPASADYGLYLMYINASDASDFGILREYQVTDQNSNIPSNSFGCISDICYYNFDLPAGGNITNLYYGTNGHESNYVMPNLNGDYYIVLFADPQNKVAETNETNNVFYVGGHLPKYFENGYAAMPPVGTQTASLPRNTEHDFTNPLSVTERTLSSMDYRTAITTQTPNAYSVAELYSAVENATVNGVWEQKMNEYRASIK